MPDLKFPEETPVILLNDQNWDAITRLGHETLNKPWFIFFWAPWCKGCHRLVPIWEDMYRRYNSTLGIAAIDSYNQELIGDRIGVTKFPTFVYFDEDNKMYFYEGTNNFDNFTNYVDNQLYLNSIPYDTPKEIDHIKKWFRKIFSLKMIPVYIVLAFVVILTSLCVFGNKQEKQSIVEARQVRYELLRRKMEQEERELLLKEKSE